MIKRHWPWVRTLSIVCIGFCAIGLLAYRFLLPSWLDQEWVKIQTRLKQEQGVDVTLINPRVRPFWFSWRAQEVVITQDQQTIRMERPRVILGLDLWPWRWRIRLDAQLKFSGPLKSKLPIALQADLTGSMSQWSSVEGVFYTKGRMDWDALRPLLKKWPELSELQQVRGNAFLEAWAGIKKGALDRVTLAYRHLNLEWLGAVPSKNRLGILEGNGQLKWVQDQPDQLAFSGFVPRWMLKDNHFKMPWNSTLDYVGHWTRGQGEAPQQIALEVLHWSRPQDEGFLRGKWQGASQSNPAQVAMTLKIPRLFAKTVSEWIPDQVLSGDVTLWLKQAFSEGAVEQVQTALRGPVNGFPFDPILDQVPGSFWTTLQTHKLKLHYGPGWPDLLDLDAHVSFQGRQLKGEIQSGKVSGSQIQKAVFVIPTMRTDQPSVLELDADITGQVTDTLNFFQNSPLKSSLGKTLSSVDWRGPMELNLHIHNPLRPELPLIASGHYQLQGVDCMAGPVSVSDLKGIIDFENESVKSSDLQGRVKGEPWSFKLSSTEQEIKLDSAGLLELSLLNHVSGKTKAECEVHVPLKTGAPQWYLSSNLEGITIQKVPVVHTLDKASTEKRPLSLVGTLTSPIEFSGQYGSDLRFKGALDPKTHDRLERLGVLLGPKGTVPWPQKKGWALAGSLALFDGSLEGDALGAMFATSTAAQDWPLVDLNLMIGEIKWRNWNFRDTRLQSQGEGLSFENAILSGRLNLPLKKDDPYRVDLSRWQIASSAFAPAAEGSAVTPSSEALSTFKPDEIPSVVFHAKGVEYGPKWRGQVSFILNPVSKTHALGIQDLHIEGESLDLLAQGEWAAEPGKNTRTHLKGVCKSTNLGRLIRSWDLNSSLAEAPGTFEFDTQWPGHPLSTNWNNVDGELDVQLGSGRLLDVDPGVGRVVGLLNLNSLIRRLKLDFSDFYKKGFSFDQAQGHFRFHSGDLKTDDLRIKGSSAKISIQGRTGLVKKDYDLKAVVEPQVSGSLPLAAAVAIGSPAVGAVVWVADKLLSGQVNAISVREYHITGAWDNPTISLTEEAKATDQHEKR